MLNPAESWHNSTRHKLGAFGLWSILMVAVLLTSILRSVSPPLPIRKPRFEDQISRRSEELGGWKFQIVSTHLKYEIILCVTTLDPSEVSVRGENWCLKPRIVFVFVSYVSMEVGASETKNFCLKREKNRRNAARSKYKEAPRSRKSLWGKVVNSKGENWIEKLWKAKGQNKDLYTKSQKTRKSYGLENKNGKKEPWNVNKTLSTSQDSLGIITFDTVATQQLKRFALLCSLALSVPHVPYKTLRASHQQHLDPPAITTSVDDVWYQEWSVMINGKKTPSLDKFSCCIRSWPPWTRRPQHPEGLQRKNNNKTNMEKAGSDDLDVCSAWHGHGHWSCHLRCLRFLTDSQLDENGRPRSHLIALDHTYDRMVENVHISKCTKAEMASNDTQDTHIRKLVFDFHLLAIYSRYDLPLNSFQFTLIIHHVYYMINVLNVLLVS